MAKRTVSDSFIIRVYRVDTEDPRALTGLVEAIDGTVERVPFTSIDELAAALSRGAGRRNRRTGLHNRIRRGKGDPHGSKEES